MGEQQEHSLAENMPECVRNSKEASEAGAEEVRSGEVIRQVYLTLEQCSD